MASWCDLNKCWKRLNSFTALCYLFIFTCDICSIFCRLKTLFPIKGTVSWDFLLLVYFVNRLPPRPLIIASGSFLIFLITTPAANLPPIPLVLLIPVANCHQCHWHWRQISNKVTLKKKNYLYVDSTTQRSSKKKKILIEDFFICHWCQWHWWCTLSYEYLCKFKTVLMEHFGAGGKLIREKNLKPKILWHCPFK